MNKELVKSDYEAQQAAIESGSKKPGDFSPYIWKSGNDYMFMYTGQGAFTPFTPAIAKQLDLTWYYYDTIGTPISLRMYGADRQTGAWFYNNVPNKYRLGTDKQRKEKAKQGKSKANNSEEDDTEMGKLTGRKVWNDLTDIFSNETDFAHSGANAVLGAYLGTGAQTAIVPAPTQAVPPSDPPRETWSDIEVATAAGLGLAAIALLYTVVKR